MKSPEKFVRKSDGSIVFQACEDSNDYAERSAALAAAPTPPAQKELSPEEIGQDGYPTVDPGMLPPAQKSEPVAWIAESGNLYGREHADSYDVSRFTPLYTHPQSDALRQAAEELSLYFRSYPHEITEYMPLVWSLRAALEKKS